ncbi:Acyl-CoA-binding protein [Paramyrothecium foliicola]|nr:Acyl-CoA-binding protein [Paramyrothecium foliicola]
MPWDLHWVKAGPTSLTTGQGHVLGLVLVLVPVPVLALALALALARDVTPPEAPKKPLPRPSTQLVRRNTKSTPQQIPSLNSYKSSTARNHFQHHPITMSAPQSDAFKKAVVDSKKLTSKPSNEDLLDLYVYKYPLRAYPALPSLRLGFANPASRCVEKGKAKKNAWQKVADEKISAETAQERYVALVEKLKGSCGYDENKEPEAVGN